MIRVLLCLMVGHVAASVRSAELVVIRSLYHSRTPNITQLMRAIQSELPELAVNREKVQEIVERFAGPMTVPLWFHEAAGSVPFGAPHAVRLRALRMRAPAFGRRRGAI